jgi:hypothetical protein
MTRIKKVALGMIRDICEIRGNAILKIQPCDWQQGRDERESTLCAPVTDLYLFLTRQRLPDKKGRAKTMAGASG